MSSPKELPVELDRLAREFIARERRGEHPTISEYVRRFPEYEDGIREVFPMLAVMEGVKPSSAGGSSQRAAALDPDVRTLGDYQLLRVVGRGGMGVVYEAEQATLGRRVALKVLPPQASLDPRFIERFRIEAQAAAGLQHPNIVPVIGLGEDEGVHYFAMQFIEGLGLDEVLDQTRLLLEGSSADAPVSGSGIALRLFAEDVLDASSSTASDSDASVGFEAHAASGVRPDSRSGRRRYRRNIVRIGLQAAEALAFAHARGVLHRDVKPSNIMLDDRGRTWIADFGLCRQQDSDGLTQTGDLVGTLRYMAPECFQGVYDVRADVYGLGLTLYELLLAEPAFEDTNRAALIRKVTQESPPKLRSRDPTIPEDLATIVHKAIAREPGMRYPTAEALAADLRAYLAGRPISARAPSLAYILRATVRRHRPLAATILASILVLIAGTVFYVKSVKETEARARLEHYAANIAAAETALRDGDLPHARQLLGRAPPEYRGWEWRHLKSRLEPGIRTYQSVAPSPARDVAHSPDGRWLAVAGRAAVHVYDQESGKRVRRLKGGAHKLAWGPESSRLAVANWGEVRVHSWPEGKPLMRRSASEPTQDICFDPAGTWLYTGGGDCLVHVLDARTFREVATVSLPSKLRSLAVNATGSRLAAGRLDGRVSMVDTETWEVLWTQRGSRRGIRGLAFVGEAHLASTSFEGALHVLHAESGSLAQVLPHEGAVFDVAAAPGGNLLAAVHANGRLTLWDPHTGMPLETRSHGRAARAVSFRPDGLGVVTASTAGTLIEWAALTGRDAHVLTNSVDGVLAVATQRGGPLAASGGVDGVLRLWDLDTRELVRAWPQHTGWILALAFSPDGTLVASAGTGSPASIVVRRIGDGGVVHRLVGHPHRVRAVAFSADGRAVISAGDDGRLCAWSIRTGELIENLALSKGGLNALAVSRTGLIAVAGVERRVILIDGSTWRERARLTGHDDMVKGLDFHPGGTILASVSADQTTRVWDTASGATLRVLAEHDPELGDQTEVVQCVAFHPSGSRLATGSRNSSVIIWDWERGQRMLTLRGHTSWVHDLAFTSDGETLVTCGSDRTVRISDTRTASERFPMRRLAWERARRARPLVETLMAQGLVPDAVLAALAQDRAIAAPLREAALRYAHAQRDSPEGQRQWMWQALGTPDRDREVCAIARAMAAGLIRFADLRSFHDPEAYVLAGAANYRLGKRPVRGYMSRALTMDTDTPDVHAAALSFLVLSHLEEDDLREARKGVLRLDSFLTRNPAALTPRTRALRAEARAALDLKNGR